MIKIEKEKHDLTLEELNEQFDGVSCIDIPRGVWCDEEGKKYDEQNYTEQIDKL